MAKKKEADIKVEPSEELEEEKSKAKFFTEIDYEARQIIDKYKERGIKISSMIEDAIDLYELYHSMSANTHAIIDRYAKRDESNPEVISYDEEFAVIEEAIHFFDKSHHIRKEDEDDVLLIRARKERDMMLIGKMTFKQLIDAAASPKKSIDKPQKRNNALDVILWYTKKPITALSLVEIIEAIQKMWVVTNFFKKIEVNEESGDIYYLTFIHNEDELYSKYWLGYFEVLFSFLNDSDAVPFKCAFEGQAFGQTLSITIKELFERKNE
ncbi:MAG: hypothetical protein ACTSR8_21230 [Promethearchaeota archaeon]